MKFIQTHTVYLSHRSTNAEHSIWKYLFSFFKEDYFKTFSLVCVIIRVVLCWRRRAIRSAFYRRFFADILFFEHFLVCELIFPFRPRVKVQRDECTCMTKSIFELSKSCVCLLRIFKVAKNRIFRFRDRFEWWLEIFMWNYKLSICKIIKKDKILAIFWQKL